MTARTAAARYARALIDVAARESFDLDQVGQQLDEFNQLLGRNPALTRVLLNPAVPTPRKRAAVVELTRKADLASVVAKLLVLLAERDRLVLLGDVVAAYRDMLLDRQNVVRAEVVTASSLPAEKMRAIEARLATVTGKRVSMGARVDPGILGGVVARVGSTVYDASIATQLEKIRDRITR
jgi:F-type H+-transporting ATPase subunit delta